VQQRRTQIVGERKAERVYFLVRSPHRCLQPAVAGFEPGDQQRAVLERVSITNCGRLPMKDGRLYGSGVMLVQCCCTA